MNRLPSLLGALFLAAIAGCNTASDITCNSCPNWRVVNSEGCAEIAAQLKCETHEVKLRDDGGCAEGLACVLTGCAEEGTSEVCSSFAQM